MTLFEANLFQKPYPYPLLQGKGMPIDMGGESGRRLEMPLKQANYDTGCGMAYVRRG